MHSNHQFIIYFQKCERETNHGIIIADRLAKTATFSIYVPATMGPIARSTAKKLINKQLFHWSKYNILHTMKSSHIISRNIYKWRFYIYLHLDTKKELEFARWQSAILLKLRSGHNELNASKHILMHHSDYQHQL